jgi:hypothetical protein
MLETNENQKELKRIVWNTLYWPLNTYDLHRFKFYLYAKGSLKSNYYEKIYKMAML